MASSSLPSSAGVTAAHGSSGAKGENIFEEYWSDVVVNDGLEKKELLLGQIRINPKNYRQAFVPLSGGRDIFIDGFQERNRALEGDVVVVKLNPKSEWKTAPASKSLVVDTNYVGSINNQTNNVSNSLEQDKVNNTDQVADAAGQEDNMQKTGKVVYIWKKVHTRIASGYLSMEKQPNGFALFVPRDHRVPRTRIPLSQCPNDHQKNWEKNRSELYAIQILDWKRKTGFAIGKLLRHLGCEGEKESETEAILMEYKVDTDQFSDNLVRHLQSNWKISKKQLKQRKDFTSYCIITIDPSTAKDLDDALSCKLLPNGNFEVGVHIADVSHFVREDDPIDMVARKRTVTFYLVDKAVTMLPPLLCEDYCSLNPGKDRLAFSVVWELKPSGQIVHEWFGKSIIRSCCKLSYDDAQSILDNPSKDWNPQELPQVFDHKISEIVTIIVNLDKIAKQLFESRKSSGAIELNQPKQWFSIDPVSGYPTSCKPYEMKESNCLVKEFMLLANISVANKILKGFPTSAFLRRQPPPSKMTEAVVESCKYMGISIHGTDCGDVQKALTTAAMRSKDGSLTQAFTNIFLKSIQRAEYFCSGTFEPDDYWHYCLSIPLYTHFTSPIRRYPDIIVHRQLNNLLNEKSVTANSMIKNTEKLEAISNTCNERKLAQFNVGKRSAELFFIYYVRCLGPLVEDALVIGLMDSSFEVLLTQYGFIKRVYCNAHNLEDWRFLSKGKKPKLILYWKGTSTVKECTQEIVLFTKVKVILQNDTKETLGYVVLIQHPKTAAST